MKLEEEWKDIEDYPNYQISNLGNVRSKKRDTQNKIKCYLKEKGE